MISSRILLASAVVVALAASIGAVSDVVQTTDGPVRGTSTKLLFFWNYGCVGSNHQ